MKIASVSSNTFGFCVTGLVLQSYFTLGWASCIKSKALVTVEQEFHGLDIALPAALEHQIISDAACCFLVYMRILPSGCFRTVGQPM